VWLGEEAVKFVAHRIVAAMRKSVLGIDTSTADTAVALVSEGELVAERRTGPGEDGRPRHAQAVLEQAESVVAEGGGWEELGLIVAGLGPGSFTGLRIGISTARGLAQSLAVPIAGVSSLDALARGMGGHPAAAGRSRLAAIDARRGELFARAYSAEGRPLYEPAALGPAAAAEAIAALGEAPLAAGDGAVRFRSDLEAAGALVPPDEDPVHRIAARHLCELAEGLPPLRAEEIEPMYLRAPDAEVWLEQDRR
jgi:tRNA threonylcarbamoyladenosine biosynthesis protein TsaB